MTEDEDQAPEDIVPPSGLTREDVLRASAAAGTVVDYTIPGAVLLDADGIPNAVGRPKTGQTVFGGLTITEAQLEKLGLTREEVPGVHIV